MGKTAKWREFTQQEIEQYVVDSRSFMDLAHKLGYNNGSYLKSMRKMVQELKLDISHFVGQGWNKSNFDYERFRKGNAIKAKNAIDALVAIRGRECEICHLTEWNEMPIPLEVHHKDGDSLNNEMDNLLLVCPNCHALTDNYCGKNINSGTTKINDEMLVDALYTHPNIRQALRSVGLSAKGGNYQRARELIFTYNIEHLL